MQKTEIENQNVIKSKIKSYLAEKAEVRFLQRLLILQYLIEHKEQSCITAGEIFHVSPRAILNWVKKVNETGELESIRDKPGKGRKTKLTSAQLDQIKKNLKEGPDKVGIKSEKWDGNTLSKYITQKMGITLQGRQCQRLLLKFGSSNKRGRPAKQPV